MYGCHFVAVKEEMPASNRFPARSGAVYRVGPHRGGLRLLSGLSGQIWWTVDVILAISGQGSVVDSKDSQVLLSAIIQNRMNIANIEIYPRSYFCNMRNCF
jgi:hypothetical protein